MKFIVHIGWEKTGTTSIQKYLDANQRRLNEFGVFYLSSPGRIEHYYLSQACRDLDGNSYFHKTHNLKTEDETRTFRDAAFKEFQRTVANLPPEYHTVLISSEHFSTTLRTPKEVSRLREAIVQFSDDIEIVVYLRDPESFVPSAYSTALKSGYRYSLSAFVNRHLVKGPTYWDRLSIWRELFGENKVRVNIFKKDLDSNKSLINDFLSKVHPSLAVADGDYVETKNRSLSRSACRFLRGFNMCIPRAYATSPLVRFQRRKFVSFLLAMPGEGLRLNEAQLRRVREKHSGSNEKIRERWFPGKTRLFG